MQSYGWNLQRLQHSRNKIASDQPYSSCNGNQCSFVFITLQDSLSYHYLQDTQVQHICLPRWPTTAHYLLYKICFSPPVASQPQSYILRMLSLQSFFVTVWNSLPSEIMSHSDSIKLSIFICHLKTHLFNKHFNLESSVIGQCLQFDLSTYDTVRTVYYYCYYYHNFSDTPDSK